MTIFAVAVALVMAGVCAVAVFGATLADESVARSDLAPLVFSSALVIGIAAALAPVLQAMRILQTHSARDVSMVLMGVFSLSYSAGLAVGLVAGMPVLWIPNSIGTVTMTTAFAVALRMRWLYRNWDATDAVRREDAAAGAVLHLGTDPDLPVDDEVFDEEGAGPETAPDDVGPATDNVMLDRDADTDIFDTV